MPIGGVFPVLVCCCDHSRRRRIRRRRFRQLFDPDDESFLRQRARQWSKDTGRACGDFFPTMRTSPDQGERVLAGRATLLSKIRSLNAADAAFASATICAGVPVPVVSRVALAGEIPTAPAGPFEAYRFEVSGFGFSRPSLGRFATRELAQAAVDQFLRSPGKGPLEGAAVREVPLVG